jgi:NAD(P)-dependent dehydrogenase (short-subunit alcohol dehydrogenase family)
MDLELRGKRAIVTGGSRGIGRAVARQLALEGADVVIAAREASALNAAAQELGSECESRVVPLTVDTRDDASVRRMVDATVDALGGVDILVNAAAMPDARATTMATLTEEMFLEAMNTKVLGYLRCIREVAPHMAANGWGRVVNVSGLAARSSASLNGAMRNVAVSAMTKSLADELGEQGINVTVVHPGVTRTEALPATLAARAEREGTTPDAVERQIASGITIGRVVDATEIAWVIAFLASPKSVSVTGDAIGVGGGQRGVIHY